MNAVKGEGRGKRDAEREREIDGYMSWGILGLLVEAADAGREGGGGGWHVNAGGVAMGGAPREGCRGRASFR